MKKYDFSVLILVSVLIEKRTISVAAISDLLNCWKHSSKLTSYEIGTGCLNESGFKAWGLGVSSNLSEGSRAEENTLDETI